MVLHQGNIRFVTSCWLVRISSILYRSKAPLTTRSAHRAAITRCGNSEPRQADRDEMLYKHLSAAIKKGLLDTFRLSGGSTSESLYGLERLWSQTMQQPDPFF